MSLESDEEFLRAGQDLGAEGVPPGMLDEAAPDIIAAPSPVSPDPGAAFDVAEYGPPTPNATTDAIAATMPPAPASIPTRDPEQDFAPGVPAGAPGSVPPGGAQAALTVPKGEEDDIKGALGDLGAARTESDEAKLAQEKEVGAAKLDYAQKRREELETRQAEDQARADADKAADIKAQASLQQADDAIKGFKFKDLWANSTTGQKVSRVLGSALLAIGAGMMKTPKYAIEILDKELADDHQQQMDHLGQLKDDYVRARTGIQDAQLGRQKIAADIMLGRARKDELIAARFDEAIAKAKDPSSVQGAAMFSAKLHEDAAKSTLEGLTMLRTLHLADEKAGLDQRLKESQIHENEANARLRDRGLGQGHRAGGGGTGGGGGGGKLAAAETALAQQIQTAKDAGRPLSQVDIYAAADKLGLPHEAKAGHPSVANVLALTGKMVTTDAAAGRGNLAGERQTTKEVTDWAAKNGVSKILQTQRELEALQKNIRDAGNNPLQQALALESAVKAARGGAATQGMLNLALSHLGGSFDNAGAVVEKIKSGGMGAKQWENFRHFVNAQQGTAQQEGRTAYDNFMKYVDSQPEARREELKNQRGRLFSGMHGFGGGEGGGSSGAQGKRIKLKDGRTGTLTSDGMFHED